MATDELAARGARYTSTWQGVADVAGRVSVVLATLLGAIGLVVYLTGYDVALMLMIVGFGFFVSGIGLLAAARGAR
jgi:hypothetical protein